MMPEEEFALARNRMVEEQIIARGVHEPRVLAALRSVPRHFFVPPDDLAWAYADGPLPIGHGQTISQPYIVALMTELLEVEPSDRVLEVGSGSGYQAAVLGELAAEVHTIEVIPELARQAEKNLAGPGYPHVHVHTGDGSPGWPKAAPYNRILVAAAAPEVPQAILDQLAEGGQLVIPVGGLSVQSLEVWKRNGLEFCHRKKADVCFVPLRGRFGWK
jgi:protein-L-isoaspartate(D-aspartate) O-methyltransferase